MRENSGRLTMFTALAAYVTAVVLATLFAQAATQSDHIERPAISEQVSPLESVSPLAGDGHHGVAVLRKPPGPGPFPAVVMIHGGLVTLTPQSLRNYVLNAPLPSRFLAAGYVVAVITYRSRDADPQSRVSAEDSLAAVNHLRSLSYVDPRSVVVYGCSGGGDLALEVAAATTDVAAIAPEEPATVLFTGIFNKDFPKRGARHTPPDSAPISADPKRYYTSKYQALTREKIRRIQSPILIVQGDQQPINHFNRDVLIPELQSARKALEIITYPGEPHCFAFGSPNPRPESAAAAFKAFRDMDAFFRRHIKTQPKPMESEHIIHVPASR